MIALYVHTTFHWKQNVNFPNAHGISQDLIEFPTRYFYQLFLMKNSRQFHKIWNCLKTESVELFLAFIYNEQFN